MNDEQLSLRAYITPFINKHYHVLDVILGEGCEVIVIALTPDNIDYSQIWKWAKEKEVGISGWSLLDKKLKITFVCNKENCSWCCGD